jgi:hypothetical protein
MHQVLATLNPEGRGKYKKELERFAALPEEEKHQTLKTTWKEVAMVAASRAKQFAATCSPKDFGRLSQLIMSGAIAIDKAFTKPKVEVVAPPPPPPPPPPSLPPTPPPPPLVFNLFGSLGQRAVSVTTPETPRVVNPNPQGAPHGTIPKTGEHRCSGHDGTDGREERH